MEKQQKAVLVRELGKAMVLGHRPIPSLKAGQLLVEVRAVMILPHDTESRDHGLFIADKLPYVLGGNIAGTVEATSPSTQSSFRKGERVFGVTTFAYPTADQGGLQEYAVLNENAIARTPEGFTHEQVATLPTNLVTSAVALFTEKGLRFPAPYEPQRESLDANQQHTLVILGAGSRVGTFGVQLAKIAGIGKIIAVAGSSNRERLLRLGATDFVDRHLSDEEIVRRIHAVTGADGVTHVYDCYSRTFELAAELLSSTRPSMLRVLHPMSDEQRTMVVRGREKLCDAQFMGARNGDLEPEAERFWMAVREWLIDGKVVPSDFRVIEGLEQLDEINAALDDYREQKRGPQVVVVP